MLTQMLPQRPLATHQLNFVHNLMIFELIPTLNWTFEQISFSSFNTLWFTFRIETSKRNCDIWWNNSSLCNKAAKTMQNHWEILNWNLTLPDLIIQIQEKNCRCIFLPKMERIKCMPFFSCILHPITTKNARKNPKMVPFSGPITSGLIRVFAEVDFWKYDFWKNDFFERKYADFHKSRKSFYENSSQHAWFS